MERLLLGHALNVAVSSVAAQCLPCYVIHTDDVHTLDERSKILHAKSLKPEPLNVNTPRKEFLKLSNFINMLVLFMQSYLKQKKKKKKKFQFRNRSDRSLKVTIDTPFKNHQCLET